VVSFIQNAKVEGDLFKIQKLYNEMAKRTSIAKSDFSNNMTKRLNKEELKITVHCGDGYTDRKWNGLFRGIDFSEFNIEKDISKGTWGDYYGDITITLKK
jgi:hypothetical protein